MKKQKNLTVKIVAWLALGAILISVVWTGILFIYEVYFNPTSQVQDLSQEELEALIQQLQLQMEEEDEQENEWVSDEWENENIDDEESAETDDEIIEDIQE